MIVWKFSDMTKNEKFPLSIFLCFYLLFSLFTFHDYGISADEEDNYICGVRYVNHYIHKTSPEDEAGGIFSLEQASHDYVYSGFLRLFCWKKAEIYHLANLLLAIPAYFAIYAVLFMIYKKSWFAFLGPVFLFIFFRFSGDIPINPKDGPFAVFYFFSLVWIFFSRYRIKDVRLEAIILGGLIGFVGTLRVIGLSLIPILVVYRFYEYFVDQRSVGQKINFFKWFGQEWLNFVLVFIISQCWIMAFWPYIGSNYFGNWLNVFRQSTALPFDFPMAFMGHLTSSLKRPWYYLFVWFGICTPLFILAFFFTSFYLFSKKMTSLGGKFYFLLTSTLLLQLFLYLALKPNLFNSMRYYLFVAPIMSAMAAMAFIEFISGDSSRMWKRGVVTLVIFNVVLVLIEFFRLYPYQYIYFNEIVGGLKGVDGQYETEYWNTSFKEASEWLAKNEAVDPKKIYRIKVGGTPWQELYYFKPNMFGAKDMKNPEYEILELRRDMPPLAPNQKLIYAVSREGVPFVRVLKYISPSKNPS